MCVRRDTRPNSRWFMRGMIGVVAALALAGCGSAPKPAPAHTTARTLPAASAQGTACADYNALLEALRWTSWATTSATAVGTLVYNDCTPNCAEGHFHHVPGTRVTLTVPSRSAGGQQVWSEVQENPEPPGYETGPYHGGPQPRPKAPI